MRILNQRVLIGICIAVLILSGCGKKEDAQQAQSSGQSPVESVATNTNQNATFPLSMAGQEQSIADAEASRKQAILEMNNGKEIEPIEMGILKSMLPAELTGMKRTDASVERNQMMGIDIAVAEARYEAGDGNGSIKIVIMDAGNLSGPMRMGLTGWAVRQYSRETETGYEKTITYNGYKGMEEYYNNNKNGGLHVFVADRFLVEIEGNQTTMDVMKQAMDKIDIKKLASLASGS